MSGDQQYEGLSQKSNPYLLNTDAVYLSSFTLGKKFDILESKKGECILSDFEEIVHQ